MLLLLSSESWQLILEWLMEQLNYNRQNALTDYLPFYLWFAVDTFD